MKVVAPSRERELKQTVKDESTFYLVAPSRERELKLLLRLIYKSI